MPHKTQPSRHRHFGSFLSFRLPADLESRLRHICDANEQTISAYVRHCVVESLSLRAHTGTGAGTGIVQSREHVR